MEDCIFCKIAKGELPSTKYYEDDFVICIKPLGEIVQGHTLLIPKKHSENIFDITKEDLEKVVGVARELALKFKNEGATGINLLHASGKDAEQSVFHFHMHLIPRHTGDNLKLHSNF